MTDHVVPPASQRLHRADLATALPDLRSPQRLHGLTGPVDVWRDPDGVPHARAGAIADAFFGEGYVNAL